MVASTTSGSGNATTSGTALTDGGIKQVVAFGIVALFLVTAADFETTAPLAVAFSGVFLLSTAMLVGPVAFGRITSLVTKGNAP